MFVFGWKRRERVKILTTGNECDKHEIAGLNGRFRPLPVPEMKSKTNSTSFTPRNKGV